MNNKLPITRLSKFFSEDDFDLHIKLGQEYLHGDLNMTVILYRVDRITSNTDDIYGEASTNEIKYLPPIEVNALVRIEEPKNNQYTNNNLRYLEPGNLILSVYIKHLNDLNIDIKYGDYIAYPESENRFRYYTVTNDGKVTSDNKHTHFGYRASYRTITCVPTQENEFKGI